MANSPYTVVVFSQTTGNVVPNAAVQIYNRNPDGSSGSLAVIYSDEAGANSISQPGATANAQGVFVFYADGKAYNAVYNGFTQPIDVGLTDTKVPNAVGGIAPYEFDTVTNAQNGVLIGGKTVTLEVGDVIRIKERANGVFDVISGTGTANGYNVIAHSTLNLSFSLRFDDSINMRRFFNTSGDFGAALTVAAGINKNIYCPAGTYSFTTTFNESGLSELNIVGDGKFKTIFLANPNSDSIAIGSSIKKFSMRGVQIDGNRQSGETRTSTNSRLALKINAPSATPGESLSLIDVFVTNTPYHSIDIDNYDNVEIDSVTLKNNYGNGIVVTGCRTTRINGVLAEDVGNLLAEGSRSGSAIIVTNRGTSRANSNTTVSNVVVRRCTDSMVYIGNGASKGNDVVAISNISGENIGKDGVKFEQSVTNGSMTNVSIKNYANAGVRFLGSNLVGSGLVVTDGGLTPWGTDSINLATHAISLDNFNSVHIDNVVVDSIESTGTSTGSGSGIYARNGRNLKASCTIKNAKSTPVILEGVRDFDLHARVFDGGDSLTGTKSVITFGEYTGTPSNGRLSGLFSDSRAGVLYDWLIRTFGASVVSVDKFEAVKAKLNNGFFEFAGAGSAITNSFLPTPLELDVSGTQRPNVLGQANILINQSQSLFGFSGSNYPEGFSVNVRIGPSGAVTITHNDGVSNIPILTRSGSNISATSNQLYKFTHYNGSFYEQ